jgi:hypothetical protein
MIKAHRVRPWKHHHEQPCSAQLICSNKTSGPTFLPNISTEKVTVVALGQWAEGGWLFVLHPLVCLAW